MLYHIIWGAGAPPNWGQGDWQTFPPTPYQKECAPNLEIIETFQREPGSPLEVVRYVPASFRTYAQFNDGATCWHSTQYDSLQGKFVRTGADTTNKEQEEAISRYLASQEAGGCGYGAPAGTKVTLS